MKLRYFELDLLRFGYEYFVLIITVEDEHISE